MAKRKYIFTQREDNIIKKYIQFCGNMSIAFERASEELDFPLHVVNHRWYRKLRYEETLFVTASGEENFRNTKNSWRDKPRNDMKITKQQVMEIFVEF